MIAEIARFLETNGRVDISGSNKVVTLRKTDLGVFAVRFNIPPFESSTKAVKWAVMENGGEEKVSDYGI